MRRRMWGVIPRRASRLMGYCLTLRGVASAFSSMTTGCLCLASPTPAVSAQANGYLWTHGCISGAITSEGLGTKVCIPLLKLETRHGSAVQVHP